MPAILMSEVLQQLRSAVLRPEAADLTDGQLLECFVSRRDPAALETLVRRHARMVWGVCRRTLRDYHDAEDAFQATFLVLVRRAASIHPRSQAGNWLYGVAHQTALKARASRAKRQARERSGAELPEIPVTERGAWSDVQPVLDQEVSRLPEKYRTVLVLCDLEGKTGKEAARQLGLPTGTLASRLARARAMLARRLARLGLALSVGTVTGVLFQSAAAAEVPAMVLPATVKAVTLVAAGQATRGVISTRVVSLMEGVLQAMWMTRVRMALGICLTVGLLVLGSVFGYHTLGADKTAPEPARDRLADTLILLDKQWWEAASRYDVDTLSKILADDYICFTATGPLRWNKAIALENYRKGRFLEVKFLTEREVVRLDKHCAMMSYEVKWRAEDKGKGPRPGWGRTRMIHLWVQRGGGWVLRYTEGVHLPVPIEIGPAPVLNPFHLKDFPPGLLAPPAPKPEPAWKNGVRASGSWATETPDKAFDGKRDTDWNSGTYAPAWIERDLGAYLPLASIALFPCQDIPGTTIHEVWVSYEPIGNDRTKAKLVHTFMGPTTNMQQLKYDFPKGLSARYVQVRSCTSPTWIAWWEVEIRVREQGQVKVVPLHPQAEQKPAQ
jgi:RNA polymerase sigma factor (sigma-70 family)